MTGRVLFIDLETRSAIDLREQGVHVYARHASTDVWCACYAFSDDRQVRTWLPGQPVPAEIVAHVRSGGMVSAHNFGFESALWTHVLTPRHGWPALRPEQGHCTAAEAAAMALPRSLDGAAQALKLGVTKDPVGYQEMLRMCRPRRVLPDGTYVWWDEPERLERLTAYCSRDVEIEMQVYDALLRLSAGEHRVWSLDMVINERGVSVDLDLVARARVLAEQAQSRADRRLYELTGKAVEKFTQNARLLSWLQKQGVDTDSLDKSAMRHLLRGVKGELTADIREILTLRQQAAKASTAKLAAMQAWACPDGRVRGMLLYHGATTGRWSGKGPQPQNLPRPTLSQAFIDAAIADIKAGCDMAWLEMMYGPALVTIADCIRGCLVAAPGRRFVMADFSNIEGRVLAWLAGEDWKVEAFRAYDEKRGPDLYLVAAAGIYGVKVDTLNKKSPERQIGKVAELALGYQGGVGAFQKMAEGSGVEVSDERADEIKVAWRAQHPAVVALWRDLERAALEACEFQGRVVEAAQGRIRYVRKNGFLWCRLPSGRVLSYASPRVEDVATPWGETRRGVTTMTPKGSAWFRRSVYGGGLTENVVQAIARDLMAEAMLRLEAAGYPVVLTVHDEVVAEVPDGFGSVEEFVALMTELPRWAEGCPVTAEGDSSGRYRK